jgi:hypothetical protein
MMERLDPVPVAVGARRPGVDALRWLGAIGSIACVAGALRQYQPYDQQMQPWWLLGAALALSTLWTLGIRFPAPGAEPVVMARRWWRVAIGGLLFVPAAVAFAQATHALYLNWVGSFDRTWVTWAGTTVLMAVGLDIASGPWKRIGGTVRAWHLAALVVLVGLAALYRLGNIFEFPGEAAASQVEELQTGQWGFWFQQGLGQMRWEYLSHQWLAGVGIWFGGPTMLAMRFPFAVVSVLKTIPLFLWLLLVSGPVGALVGTALYVSSAWDVVLSRIPNNHNALIVAAAFVLLAGPIRRGRPSAYVILGFLCGFLLHEYVAYRPLIVLAVVGTVWISWRDRRVGWPVRIAPLLTLAVVISMSIPLFLGRLTGDRLWNEYFNGWNRARAIQPYYNPNDDWRTTLDKRIDRAFDALALFYFSGDSHPGRRVEQPLVDPITGVFLIIGVGCAVARLRHPVFALTLAGLGITIAGTLVLTGNFDIGRAGGAVPYVYACVGYGAAALAALARGRGRGVQGAMAILLVAAVAGATYRNTQALFSYWESPSVRRALRSNLAYLSSWLGRNARPDEQVVAVAPGYHHVLQGNDAAWLRGRDMNGIAAWDVESALRYWSQNPGKTLLVVFAGPGTTIVQRYLEWLIPGLQMQFEPDPLRLDGEIAYAHIDEAPAALRDGLAAVDCYGGQAVFRLVDRTGAETLFTLERRAPFVDAPTLPGELRGSLQNAEPAASKVIAEFRSDFTVEHKGAYRFTTQAYPGLAELSLDGQPYPTQQGRDLHLEAGSHRLELKATLAPDPVALVVRLFWSGPDSGNKQEIMPLYRLAPADPKCASGRPLG